MPPAGFMPDSNPGVEKEIPNGFQHYQRDRQRSAAEFCRCWFFDEIGSGLHRDAAGGPDVFIRDQFAGLENDLEVRGTASGFDRGDFVKHEGMIAGEKGRD